MHPSLGRPKLQHSLLIGPATHTMSELSERPDVSQSQFFCACVVIKGQWPLDSRKFLPLAVRQIQRVDVCERDAVRSQMTSDELNQLAKDVVLQVNEEKKPRCSRSFGPT